METRVYSEERFEIKLARERRLYGARGLMQFYQPEAVPELFDLRASEIAEIIRAANLARAQAHVFGFYITGFTWVEIATLRDVSRQACQRVYLKAQAKMQRASRKAPRFGLTDVYAEDVFRRGTHEPYFQA